ncbi:MAG: SDR family oxidoreductase [Candidatus Parcubacteria bacterium]|nr:SDR family oxidoreductase [Candidatus Parcubacteria bacterium]
MNKKKKTILITGASSGIGKQIAEFLSSKGHVVYGASRNPQENILFHAIKMDITDEISVRKAISLILEKEKTIDVLINNAGFGLSGSVEDTSMNEIRHQFETNFFGTVTVTKEVLPFMRQNGSGLIITISSMAGVISLPHQAFYSASKFALEGYTEALRLEVRSHGINVVNILPGDFSTNFTANRKFSEQSQKSTSPYIKSFQKTIDIYMRDEKRGPKPFVIAELVNKIIDMRRPKSRYLVGGIIQKIGVFLKRILPGSLWEKIMISNYHID